MLHFAARSWNISLVRFMMNILSQLLCMQFWSGMSRHRESLLHKDIICQYAFHIGISIANSSWGDLALNDKRSSIWWPMRIVNRDDEISPIVAEKPHLATLSWDSYRVVSWLKPFNAMAAMVLWHRRRKLEILLYTAVVSAAVIWNEEIRYQCSMKQTRLLLQSI